MSNGFGQDKFRAGSPNIAASFDAVEARIVALEQPAPPPGGYTWPADQVCPLSNPIRITTGISQNLLPDRDYDITVNATQPVVLTGGRNVRVRGKVAIPANAAPTEDARRGMIVKNVTGTFWIADLLLTGAPTSGQRRTIADGLVIQTPNAQSGYVQNYRGEGISAPVPGDWSSAHPDGMFSWAPARRMYVDRVTVETDYQGVMLSHVPYLGMPAEAWDVRRVNVRPIGDGPISVWPTDGPHLPYGPDTTYQLRDIYTGAPIKYGLEKGVGVEVMNTQANTDWHLLGTKAGEPPIRTGWVFKHADGTPANMSQSVPGDYVEWTNVNGKTGRVTFGDPPGGDYVKAGSL